MYAVRVVVGDHVYETTQGDVPDPGAGVWLGDGLRVAWTFPDDPWPCQPEPVECSFAIVAADVEDLRWIEVGLPVEVVCIDLATATVWASFYGRVTEPTITPLERKGRPPWSVCAISAADYLADLAGVPITLPIMARETAAVRLARLATLAAGQGIAIELPDALPIVRLEATTEVTETTLAEALEDVLSQAAAVDGLRVADSDLPTYGGRIRTDDLFAGVEVDSWARYVVQPLIVGGLLAGFTLVPIIDRLADPALVSGLPGRLEVVGGLLTLTVDSTGGAVPAGRIELATTWQRTKQTDVGQVTVTHPILLDTGDPSSESVTVTGAGPVARTFDSDLVDRADAVQLAEMYLPDSPTGWTVESMSWLPVAPVDVAGWMPDHTATGVPMPYVRPVVVTDVVTSLWLEARPYYAGQLGSVDLLLEDARPALVFGVRRNLPRPVGSDVAADSLTIGALAAAFPTLAIEDVDPALTIYDLRLARS